MPRFKRIVLIGFSGTGKSTTGRCIADRTGWQLVDLDEELAAQFGMTIPEVFERLGESAFREAERKLFISALQQEKVVIGTGGGAAVAPECWGAELLGHDETLTVALDATPETILNRLLDHEEREGASVARPMITGDDQLGRIERLKQSRQEAYDQARLSLPVDRRSPADVAEDVVSIVENPKGPNEPAVRLNAPSGSSAVYVREELRHAAGELIRDRWPKARNAWIITDSNVGRHYGDSIVDSLTESGVAARILSVPPGESSKSLAVAGELFDQILATGIERSDLIVALGGGVIGDLAGFVAATVLRGVGLVQVPTSLLAMVDSSIGGKTGVNHSAGKNLIGAFYQPPLVLIDPDVLRTLPPRELSQGWAEIVKHAVIQPSTPGGVSADLESFLARNIRRLLALEEPAIGYLIRRNVELKSRVVEADERESGIRAFLNFGHTLGHAIEASDYRQMHGEAVALGMRAAARISRQRGFAGQERIDQIDQLIDGFGLPRTGEFDTERVISLVRTDKKRSGGRATWVLLNPAGGVQLTQDVLDSDVRSAITEIST